MKRMFGKFIVVLLAVSVVFPVSGIFAAERHQLNVLTETGREIPVETVKRIGYEEASIIWGKVTPGAMIPLCDVRGNLIAYEMVYALNGNCFPADEVIREKVQNSMVRLELENKTSKNKFVVKPSLCRNERWGIGSYGTLIIGARYDVNIMLEYHTGLPPYYTRLNEARARAAAELNVPLSAENPVLRRIYAAGFLDKWFLFEAESKNILINVYSMKVEPSSLVADLARVERTDIREQNAPEIRRLWNARITFDMNEEALNRTSGTTTRSISGVPFYDYHVGCTPTAAAMVLGYWDACGYTNLIRTDDQDLIEELGAAMGTINFFTPSANVDDGIVYVANNICNYQFSCENSGIGSVGPAGTVDSSWGKIQDEIEAGRPLIWGVNSYKVPSGQVYAGSEVDHAVAVVGYRKDTSSNWYWPWDRWYCYALVHNTWDTQEHYWEVLRRSNINGQFYMPADLAYNTCTISVVPGGMPAPATPVVSFSAVEFTNTGGLTLNKAINVVWSPKLSWSSVPYASYYYIYIRKNGGIWKKISTTTSIRSFIDLHTYTDGIPYISAPPGDWIEYSVKAVNRDGAASAYSNSRYYQIVPAPDNGDGSNILAPLEVR